MIRFTQTQILTNATALTKGTTNSNSFIVKDFYNGMLLINVTATNGSPTLNITFQTSLDDSTYYDVSSDFDQITQEGQYAFPVNDFAFYVRVKYTVGGGASDSITVTTNFVGKT